jgi:hypothetical protein
MYWLIRCGSALEPERTHPAKVVRGFCAAIEAGYVHWLFLSADSAAMGLREGVITVRASEKKADDRHGGSWFAGKQVVS